MMKAPISLAVLFLWGCSEIRELNNRVYDIQLQAISESPYIDAVHAKTYVHAQQDFWLSKSFKHFHQKLLAFSEARDTIVISENFDAICVGCPSDRIEVLVRDTIYSLSKEILGHGGEVGYILKSEYFNFDSKDRQFSRRHTGIIEIFGKIRKGNNWKDNPLQYGLENCADGDHTIVTVLYPDRRIDALYVRCWVDDLNRRAK